MNILGIVTEYNPFHNGHIIHIEKSKKESNADFVIAVMSSNFVQRGEPAIADKWTRTKMALSHGVDMVIELPVIYSTASAEFFAKSAIKLLDDTGIVDSICFGSEIGNIEILKKTADILSNESEQFCHILKEGLNSGLVFPAARANALSKISNINSEVLNNPNNILAVEYIKALKELKSNIMPLTIQREKSDYNSCDIDGNIASATAIRKLLHENNNADISDIIPNEASEILSRVITLGSAPIFYNDFSSMLNYRLRTINLKELSEILDVTEGLENRILRAIDANYLISDISDFIKTKRYTYTKIQRALLHIILNITLDDLNYFNSIGYSQYIRVLGFKKQSQKLLSLLCENAKIAVVTNIKNATSVLTGDGIKMLNTEVKATDIYFMASHNPAYRTPNKEFTTPLAIL